MTMVSVVLANWTTEERWSWRLREEDDKGDGQRERERGRCVSQSLAQSHGAATTIEDEMKIHSWGEIRTAAKGHRLTDE